MLDEQAINLFLGNGDESFQDRIVYALNVHFSYAVAGAFRNGNKLDPAVANDHGRNIAILLNSC